MTAPARAGRAVLHAPGILSPRKITVKCARCARVLWMALRATLDSDLPRQDLGTYQEDGLNDGTWQDPLTSGASVRDNAQVATLHEYFSTEFKTGSTHFDYTFKPASGGQAITVIARVHFDFTSYARYISYFVTEGQGSIDVLAHLTQYPAAVLERADSSVEMSSGHAAIYGAMVAGNDLPFSGRVFLYVDEVMSDADKAGLIKAASDTGIHLEIKDRVYSDYMTSHEKPWAFISHDSRDKDSFVSSLASKLRSMMCPVWYDDYSLRIGQSLRESIDRGLSEAPKCILVLSPNFLSNPGWAKGELNAAVNRHFSEGGSVVLPVWLNLSRAEVAAYSPLVADIVALKADMDMGELARRLFVEIRPF